MQSACLSVLSGLLACLCEQLKLMILSNYYVAAVLVVFIHLMVHSILHAFCILEAGYNVSDRIIA
jgi:hypothetical protein